MGSKKKKIEKELGEDRYDGSWAPRWPRELNGALYTDVPRKISIFYRQDWKIDGKV